MYFSLPTVHSFLDLVKDLFSIQGVKVFLSERLSQDPLENFLGKSASTRKGTREPICAGVLYKHTSLASHQLILC